MVHSDTYNLGLSSLELLLGLLELLELPLLDVLTLLGLLSLREALGRGSLTLGSDVRGVVSGEHGLGELADLFSCGSEGRAGWYLR